MWNWVWLKLQRFRYVLESYPMWLGPQVWFFVVLLKHFIQVLLLCLSTSSFQTLPNSSFNPYPIIRSCGNWATDGIVICAENILDWAGCCDHDMNSDSVKGKEFLTDNQLLVSQEILYRMKLAYTMLCLEWLIYSDVKKKVIFQRQFEGGWV